MLSRLIQGAMCADTFAADADMGGVCDRRFSVSSFGGMEHDLGENQDQGGRGGHGNNRVEGQGKPALFQFFCDR